MHKAVTDPLRQLQERINALKTGRALNVRAVPSFSIPTHLVNAHVEVVERDRRNLVGEYLTGSCCLASRIWAVRMK